MADPTEEAPESPSRRAVRALRGHPWIAAVVAGCVAAGSVLAIALLPDDWALARRIAAGSVGGAGVGLIITAIRMIG